jgi:phosphate transport system substrate-binding protein
MSRVLGHVLAGLLLAGAAAGCRRAPEPAVRNVVVVGSRSIVPLVRDLADRFQEEHDDVRINIEPALADRTVADTRQGLADVGLLGRALRPDETGLHSFALARDGVAFVVHRDNPVRDLPEAQLVGLLSRVYTDWKEVGGSDRPVVIVGPGEGRGLRDFLLEQFSLRPVQLRPDPALSGSEQVLQAVASQPAALGYTSLGAAEAFAARHPVRLLKVQDVPATLENVRNGRYPLIRPLVLLSREPAVEAAREFLEFARSAEVRDLVRKYGFVPVAP